MRPIGTQRPKSELRTTEMKNAALARLPRRVHVGGQRLHAEIENAKLT
jgi:hypothetical protein